MMISQQTFCGKTAEQLRLESPVFCAVEALRETTWLNDKKLPFAEAARSVSFVYGGCAWR